MGKSTPWKDEYTLLCEKCGYVVEGLDTAGPCPECGKPIAESLPERRIGTPWQQKPGVKSLVRTWWMTLRHPKKTLDVLSNSPHRSLAIITMSIGGFVASFGWMSFLFFPDPTPYEYEYPSNWSMLLPSVLLALIAFFLFFMLSFIESLGLRFIGARKGFRVSAGQSKSITAHATIGWLLLAVGFAFGQVLGDTLIYVMTPEIPPSFGTDPFDEFVLHLYAPPTWVYTVNRWLHILILPGFLFFEFFAYLGLRRCKYANRIRPQEQTDG